MRIMARWGEDEPMKEDTAILLAHRLARRYGRDKVRFAVLCVPGAIEKVIDNERDAQETLRNLAAEMLDRRLE